MLCYLASAIRRLATFLKEDDEAWGESDDTLEIADDPECVKLMEEFIRSKPELWHEDIGGSVTE